jgi:hypothetical protein
MTPAPLIIAVVLSCLAVLLLLFNILHFSLSEVPEENYPRIPAVEEEGSA